MGKMGKNLRFYTYKIENKKKIIIDQTGQRDQTYEDFCATLPDDEPRYGVIDLEYTTDDGRPTSKLLFVTWNPDSGPVMKKMLYSSSKEQIKTALNGIQRTVNCTDRAELDFDESILPL